ncbi:RNAPII transcription regulator C-terminal-domain-containing protein [Geopyxis carbonaria]|nr:RNAPII transcription regulator C-terminal-domain-containing protein [Geopyxis carbonaria]
MEARLFMLNVEKNPIEAKRIATECAKRIENKELKFLEIVQSLREYLTDDDTTVRAKAIGYLSAVLAELGSRSFTRQQVPVVAQFMCDRLEDETGLGETSSGLTALAKMHHFGKDEATQVMTALMKVDLPKHPLTTRFKVLTLVDALMSEHRDALKSMGDKFVTGFAELVGGEKDPRNLMIVFSVAKVILVEFDIVRHVELMYDVVYCYFPISFRPPPDDPYHITAQDLKKRLRECIASTHYFAGQVFPQLIEKLDSTSPSVKLDVLQTMAACALSYGPQTMSTQSSQLWDAVKYEILKSSDEDELTNEALLVLKAVATTLSTGLTTYPPPATPLARYLKTVVQECMKQLQEPQQKQAKPAGRILASIATANSVSYSFIVQTTMPALLLVYSDLGSIAKQRALLQSLNGIFDSTVAIYGHWTDMKPAPLIENSLLEYKEKLFEIYSQGLMGSNKDETSFRLTAMKGLGKLCRVRKFFEESEIGMVVQYLDEIALGGDEKGEVRDEALQILRDISTYRSSLIMSITFPAFMAQLPDSEEEKKPYTGTLEALAKLSFERPVFEVLLTRLLNKLDVVLQYGTGPDYPKAILSTLLYVLQKKPKSTYADMNTYYNRLVPPLLTKTILPLVSEKETLPVLTDDGVLEISGRLVRLIVKDLEIEQQQKITQSMFDLFVNNKESTLILEKSNITENFRPFSKTATEQQSGCVVIFACCLAAISREVALPVKNLSEFLLQNIELAENPKTPAHRLAHLRIIGLIVNKWMQKSDMDELKKIVEAQLTSISSGDSDSPLGERLRIVFWIVKALLMRTEKFGMEATQTLVELLGNPQYGSMASRGFSVLLGEDEFLNRENHAILRMLANQKTFSLCIPRIVDGFRNATSALKPNYLIALSNILRNMPSSIITPEIPTLLPLLLQSMELPDADVKLATIETLHVTVRESADALKEHVSSVITRLLSACSFETGDKEKSSNPPRVRISALRCLKSFPGALRGELLLPYKRQVMKKLLLVLDDPKRVVRKEGVDCRSKWFAMDEPEE